MIIVFITFLVILVASLMHKEKVRLMNSRSRGDWFLDVCGLLMQGIAIPFLQTIALYYLFYSLVPAWHGVFNLPPMISFFVSFVAVDYLYYWNHRILHRKSLWPFHHVHHTPEAIDLLVTSRNSLISPFLLVYLWVNGFLIFILRDPTYFILGVSLTAALDIWRHSGLEAEPRFLSQILITPKLHAWHHSTYSSNKNFGANFVFWDRVHGTFQKAADFPPELGIPLPVSTVRKLFFPFAEENRR